MAGSTIWLIWRGSRGLLVSKIRVCDRAATYILLPSALKVMSCASEPSEVGMNGSARSVTSLGSRGLRTSKIRTDGSVLVSRSELELKR